MRIIGGRFKGRRLFSVTGKTVRPTADRIRESIFNILASKVMDAMVLDLFSGTGALGIEALSRGAREAVFVEKSRTALSAIQRNIQVCAVEGQARVIRWDIAKNLNCLQKMPLTFDLVFMDPPYNCNLIQKGLQNLHSSGCLNRGAWIVVEHGASESIPGTTAEFTRRDQRNYGKTLVTFLTDVL